MHNLQHYIMMLKIEANILDSTNKKDECIKNDELLKENINSL